VTTDAFNIDAREIAQLEDEHRRRLQEEVERPPRQEPEPTSSRTPRQARTARIWARVWPWGPLIDRDGRTSWPGDVAEFPHHMLDDHPGVLVPIDT